jgi:aminoglycoside 3-N-acetyltransferase
MGEEAAVDRVDEPVTAASIAADLRDLGVAAGDTLLVHSSLSALGWVSGGAQAVVDALQSVLTDEGTLVMPTHTAQYSDPAEWSNPPVPESWVQRIRETRPPYRPAVTPTRGMGAIPECFRTCPGVVRSAHPEVSFAAWGADAEAVAADHGFDYGLGEDSPLARVYERDGGVLLLGVGHESNTSLHLAEYRATIPTCLVERSNPVLRDGRQVRVAYDDIDKRTDDFADLGAAFEREIGLAGGTVGAAEARLANQRALVDFAVEWLEANRGGD